MCVCVCGVCVCVKACVNLFLSFYACLLVCSKFSDISDSLLSLVRGCVYCRDNNNSNKKKLPFRLISFHRNER